MTDWHDYKAQVAEHTVQGDLRVAYDIHSPQLDNTRDLLVWLPPDYATSTARYPVLYMQDGQNLFDAHTSYVGEWYVDESMTQLAQDEDLRAIIVGIPNMGEFRFFEYNPFSAPTPTRNGRGRDYMRFVIDTVKPLIDADFRTRADPAHTGIGGSSLGGLISLYGMLAHQDVFGRVAAFSPSYWLGGNRITQTIQQYARGGGKIYMDIGTRELDKVRHSDPTTASARYVQGMRGLHDALTRRGYVSDQSLCYVEDEGARHNEDDWARRFPGAMRFLFGA